jgi:hypothetical protein
MSLLGQALIRSLRCFLVALQGAAGVSPAGLLVIMTRSGCRARTGKLFLLEPTECEHSDVVGLWMFARMASNRFQNAGD